MKIIVAFLVALGTMALVPINRALANFTASYKASALSRTVASEPLTVVAQARVNISGSNKKTDTRKHADDRNSALGAVSTTRGRKAKPAKTGKRY